MYLWLGHESQSLNCIAGRGCIAACIAGWNFDTEPGVNSQQKQIKTSISFNQWTYLIFMVLRTGILKQFRNIIPDLLFKLMFSLEYVSYLLVFMLCFSTLVKLMYSHEHLSFCLFTLSFNENILFHTNKTPPQNIISMITVLLLKSHCFWNCIYKRNPFISVPGNN